MAFAGSSTISSYVKPAISQVIQGIGVDKKYSIWDTIVRIVAGDTNLLETNNVVLIYRERGEEVRCRQIDCTARLSEFGVSSSLHAEITNAGHPRTTFP